MTEQDLTDLAKWIGEEAERVAMSCEATVSCTTKAEASKIRLRHEGYTAALAAVRKQILATPAPRAPGVTS